MDEYLELSELCARRAESGMTSKLRPSSFRASVLLCVRLIDMLIHESYKSSLLRTQQVLSICRLSVACVEAADAMQAPQR